MTRATGPHFSDLATCPDAMGEGGPGGSGVSFLWTLVQNRRGLDRGHTPQSRRVNGFAVLRSWWRQVFVSELA